MKSDRLDKSGREAKVAQGPTHISRKSGTNQTSVSLFRGDRGMSVTHH